MAKPDFQSGSRGSNRTPSAHRARGTISSRALEVLLHRLEIAALPPAVAIARVAVGHLAVPHRDHGAARRRLQQYLDLRIRISVGEFGGSPRLDDPPARLELEIPSADVAVPYCERGAFLRGDLRFLPGDLFVAAAAEPSVIDVLRACRNEVGYRKLEWHSAAPRACSAASAQPRQALFEEPRRGRGEGELAGFIASQRRHLVPGLGEDAGELVLIGFCEEIAEVVLEEHDACDVLDQLRIRVGFQPLLADERADPFDVAGAVAGGHHDLADPPGVKSLQIPAPLQITHLPCGIAHARRGPTLEMLSARGD